MRPRFANLAQRGVAAALAATLLVGFASSSALAWSGPDHFGPF